MITYFDVTFLALIFLSSRGSTWFITTPKMPITQIHHYQQLQPSQIIKTSTQMSKQNNILLTENNTSASANDVYTNDDISTLAGDKIVLGISDNKNAASTTSSNNIVCTTSSNNIILNNKIKNQIDSNERVIVVKKRHSNKTKQQYREQATTTTPKITNNTALLSKERNTNKKIRNDFAGLIPYVEWRAIPMEDLRQHPNFTPLPPSNTIHKLQTIEDINLFRQDSWQWDELHKGRCTTSIASSALGFLDPQSSDILNVPLSFQSRYNSGAVVSGGLKSYHRLSSGISLTSLEDMNRELCCDATNANIHHHPFLPEGNTKTIWKKISKKKNHSSSFIANYTPKITKPMQRKQQKQQIIRMSSSSSRSRISSIRMQWGCVQEATSILTALNYFSKSQIKEVGMCHNYPPDYNKQLSSIGLYLGASPDAIIQYPNGTSEILEVKNHCPFMFHKRTQKFTMIRSSSYSSKKEKNATPATNFTPMTNIPPVYLPQLMLEMFCYSQNCTSAIMLRQTINGAYILRIKRNDEYIKQMIFWLCRFHTEYVLKEREPNLNFFWDVDGYKEFVEWTKYLASEDCVEVVDFVEKDCIQRMDGSYGRNISLFLDHIK